MPVHVSSHPVVQDCLAHLRDRRTDPDDFRSLARRIMTLLLYEATAELPVRPATVTSPISEAAAAYVDCEVVAIPVLRHRLSTNFQAQADGKTFLRTHGGAHHTYVLSEGPPQFLGFGMMVNDRADLEALARSEAAPAGRADDARWPASGPKAP